MRPIAEILASKGAIDADDRALLEGLAEKHLKRHGGGPERSLAAMNASRAMLESFARIGDPEIEATLAQFGSSLVERDAEQTGTHQVGGSTSEGQRFRILRPHARGGSARSSWRSILSCTGRWRSSSSSTIMRTIRPVASDSSSKPQSRGARASGARAGLRARELLRRPTVLRHSLHPRRQPEGSDRGVFCGRGERGQSWPQIAGLAHSAEAVRGRL